MDGFNWTKTPALSQRWKKFRISNELQPFYPLWCTFTLLLFLHCLPGETFSLLHFCQTESPLKAEWDLFGILFALQKHYWSFILCVWGRGGGLHAWTLCVHDKGIKSNLFWLIFIDIVSGTVTIVYRHFTDLQQATGTIKENLPFSREEWLQQILGITSELPVQKSAALATAKLPCRTLELPVRR